MIGSVWDQYSLSSATSAHAIFVSVIGNGEWPTRPLSGEAIPANWIRRSNGVVTNKIYTKRGAMSIIGCSGARLRPCIRARSNMSTELLVTVDEAAKRLGMGRSFLYQLIRRGELPSVRIGGLRRVAAADIEGFVERVREQGGIAVDG